MKTLLVFCLIVLLSLCFYLSADEISDRERELSEIQARIEQERKMAEEAEAKRIAAEQTKQQTQLQLNSTHQRVQELTVAERNLRQAIEQSRNLLRQTESKLSQVQRTANQALLYLLITDQTKEKLNIIDKDTYLLSLLLKELLKENIKLTSERTKFSTDTSIREREFAQTSNQASSERNRLDTITTNLRQIDTQISAFERQKIEYQERATELERNAAALQDLVNLLKEEAKRYQYTYVFPNGVEAPLRGRVITQFGPKRHDRYDIATMSNGIDIAVPENTPVRAIAEGEVVYSDWFTGLGRMIIIDHKNGFHSVYSHNNATLVRRGDNVEKGQIIAESGKTGTAEEPILHFEIRRNGTPMNPLEIITVRP